MAAITDPAAINFANTKIRPTADVMAQMYWTCKAIIAAWNAASMSAKITNTADLISDGSAADGRNQITGINATAIITQAMSFVTTFEATSNAVLNVISLVGVNTASRF